MVSFMHLISRIKSRHIIAFLLYPLVSWKTLRVRHPTLSLSITKNQRLAFNCIIVTKLLLPSLIASSSLYYLLKPFFSFKAVAWPLCPFCFIRRKSVLLCLQPRPCCRRSGFLLPVHAFFLFQNRPCLSVCPIQLDCFVFVRCLDCMLTQFFRDSSSFFRTMYLTFSLLPQCFNQNTSHPSSSVAVGIEASDLIYLSGLVGGICLCLVDYIRGMRCVFDPSILDMGGHVPRKKICSHWVPLVS